MHSQTGVNSLKFRVSVGIPTKNRKEKIKNCLKALENQSFKDFNVIVVDCSEGNETKKVCLQFSNVLDIVYIKSLKPGVSSARKLMSENCQSEILLLIDDDVYLLNNCISKLFEHYNHLKNRDKCVISGQIKYYGNLSTPIKLTPQGVGFPVSASNADYFIGALLFVPRSIYKTIPWTERFVSWGFEEVLYCLMCKRRGVKLSWLNSVLAVHDDNNQRGQLPIGIETNRAYTLLYKHIFVEPSIVNLIKLESIGFIGFFITNSRMHISSLKKFVLFVFSYIHSWTIGHLWFLKDFK